MSTFQRALCLLRCLQRGPASGADLVEYVHLQLDELAYADFHLKAGKKRLENDLKWLKTQGLEIE